MDERQQLEQAIAAQESLHGTLDDAIIDKTIAMLREKLAQLEAPEQQRKSVTATSPRSLSWLLKPRLAV